MRHNMLNVCILRNKNKKNFALRQSLKLLILNPLENPKRGMKYT